MKIGDILRVATIDEGSEPDVTVVGTVVYIHPARRYYVVEFLSLVTGERWREARWFPLKPQADFPQRKPHFDFTKKLKT